MRYALFLLLTIIACPSIGQWRDMHTTVRNDAFGVHDTSFFVSGPPLQGHSLYRFNPNGDADDGLDVSQGPVTTFASLGSYFFAGGTNPKNGVGALSTNNGASWRTVVGGPVGTNGTYVYGCWGAYPDSLVSIIALSKDTGRTWRKLPYSAGMSFAGSGACVLTNTPSWGVLRSLDSGYTWTGVTAPFSYGRLVQMGTIVFLYQRYYSFQHGPDPLPPHNGILIMSRDSGITWDTMRVDSAGIPEYVTSMTSDGKNIFVGGHNALTTLPNGIFVSTDTGRTWRSANDGLGDLYRTLAFGIWDTMIYVSMSNDAESFPFASYYRPLRELVDTTSRAVKGQPSLASDSILIYPNPSPGFFTIESPTGDIRSIVVMNLLGESLLRLGQSVSSMPRTTRLDLSMLPASTYFLRIETSKGTVLRKIVRE
jgi:hypothetical protein